MQKQTLVETIDSSIKTDSVFDDYELFEDDDEPRAKARREFIASLVYAPHYNYPKLDHLYDTDEDGERLQDKKTATYEAILELEANKRNGLLTPSEYDLYASFHEMRLKKMMLVEAAQRIRSAGSSSAQAVARREFMALNREIYGEMDEQAFSDIMTTEQARTAAFSPANDRARDIHRYLADYFNGHQFDGEETPLLDEETMQRFRQVIEERYGEVLAEVPDTDDDKEYDASECNDIMQKTFDKSGLTDAGWELEVSPTKSNPSTNADVKKFFLPKATSRTSAQLQRLILHEQEVHAHRAKNGSDSGLIFLEKGTAGYADVEEGLGVLLECVLAGDFNNQSFHRARDRYITAGLALGIDGTPKDGPATFALLWRLLALRMAENGAVSEKHEQAAKELAVKHVENAFRGTNFAMPGIIYTKLKVYYEGLKKNARYFTERQDDIDRALDQAMIGKYNHTDPDETREVMEALREKA